MVSMAEYLQQLPIEDVETFAPGGVVHRNRKILMSTKPCHDYF